MHVWCVRLFLWILRFLFLSGPPDFHGAGGGARTLCVKLPPRGYPRRVASFNLKALGPTTKTASSRRPFSDRPARQGRRWPLKRLLLRLLFSSSLSSLLPSLHGSFLLYEQNSLTQNGGNELRAISGKRRRLRLPR